MSTVPVAASPRNTAAPVARDLRSAFADAVDLLAHVRKADALSTSTLARAAEELAKEDGDDARDRLRSLVGLTEENAAGTCDALDEVLEKFYAALDEHEHDGETSGGIRRRDLTSLQNALQHELRGAAIEAAALSDGLMVLVHEHVHGGDMCFAPTLEHAVERRIGTLAERSRDKAAKVIELLDVQVAELATIAQRAYNPTPTPGSQDGAMAAEARAKLADGAPAGAEDEDRAPTPAEDLRGAGDELGLDDPTATLRELLLGACALLGRPKSETAQRALGDTLSEALTIATALYDATRGRPRRPVEQATSAGDLARIAGERAAAEVSQ